MQRRRWLQLACGLAAGAGARVGASTPPVRLAAVWACGRSHRVGVIGVAGDHAAVLSQIDVPTRAHGLLLEPGGTLLAVARRPGDWLMRWRADGEVLARRWAEAQRRFNGHLLLSRDGRRLFSAETDLDTDRSLIGVRDAASLEKIAEWPTHGLDAHQMLLDADGHLMVANGGVPASADSGRMRLPGAAIESSLVRLEGRSGELLGQWRLADPNLSLRHLAWGDATTGRTLGIALQAEHAPAEVRDAAPVLALFDGRQLRALALPDGTALAGYGSDIAHNGGDWIVSCPHADALGVWRADGRWRGRERAVGACALAGDGGVLWAGGREVIGRRGNPSPTAAPFDDATLRLDNHWLPLS